MVLNTDSSPFQSSPLDGTTSPRLFWQSRNANSENTPYSLRAGSPSPTRRSSIERLQKASRVKNSNILALEQKHEYDPTRVPQIERPLAKGFAGASIGESRPEGRQFGHQRSESKTNIPIYSPTKSALPTPNGIPIRPQTPSKDQVSPIKSSMSTSRFKSSFDPETGVWSGDNSINERELPAGKSLHRHAKSVTFDAAPPQINEYEMATPDLSSIGSNSREGSYDSMEDDSDVDHYVMHEGDSQDDSFDASLEDTDKTPVVGPDDWRQNGHDDAYEKSPMPDNAPNAMRPQHGRTDSSTSNGDHRPLPPLPGASQLSRSHSTSSNGLSATAERMLGAPRSLPSPPPASTTKSEIQNIGNGKMPLEERLKLMMLSDGGKTAAELQRERRLRRAGPRDRAESQTPERETRSPSTQPDSEADDTIGDLEEYQLPPRISRESILRRVNGNRLFERESDYNFSSPAPSSPPQRPSIPLDPDVPIPSTEDSMLDVDEDGEGSVIITRNANDEDVDDVYEFYQEDEEGEAEQNQKEDHMLGQSELHSNGNDVADDQSSTPRATTPALNDPAVVKGTSLDDPFGSLDGSKQNDFSNGLESFMLSRPQETLAAAEPEKHSMAEAQAYLRRPLTPEELPKKKPLSKPEYDGSGWGEPDEEFSEPGTPDSVIHHPVSDSEDEESVDSPVVPEQVATIKSASGSKLKTRPSATPTDIEAMREARRQVSREVPIPPIPERHKHRLSRDMEADSGPLTGDDFLDRHPSFKKRSLTLELDLGLSLDKDFERVIEAQKVAYYQVSSSTTPGRQASAQAQQSNANEKINTNFTARKQRGYLMRQNTKLVAASDKDNDDLRGYRSAGNSPVKQSRPQSWTVEPWNPQPRKRSSVRKRHAGTGPVPPLPGQESNTTALGPTAEEDIASEMATEESGERGRLFVKVMGVKDLDLPIPKSEFNLHSYFPCTHAHWRR